MKSKTMRHAIKVRLFAAVLLATCVFSGAANAQTMAIKFNLPFEVHWGKTLLPAGTPEILSGIQPSRHIADTSSLAA